MGYISDVQTKMLSSQSQPKKSSACLIALAFAEALFILLAAVVYLPGRLLVVSQALKPVDAVVVLSGGEGRVEYASKVYRDIGAKWFVITETGDHVPGYPESVSEFDAVRAMRLGVPTDAIFITPQETADTAGEAGEVRRFVIDSGIKSLVVVTDPWHTRRGAACFLEGSPRPGCGTPHARRSRASISASHLVAHFRAAQPYPAGICKNCLYPGKMGPLNTGPLLSGPVTKWIRNFKIRPEPHLRPANLSVLLPTRTPLSDLP